MIEKISCWSSYAVSDAGTVYSSHSGIKAQSVDRFGYKRVMLYDKGRSKNALVHRLVAEAFIDNPLKKKQVNHIDGNKINNHVSNLEWNTNSENTQHAYDSGLMKGPWKGKSGYDHNRSKPVVSVDESGNETEYGSVEIAAKTIGGDQSFISKCARGKVKSAYGFKWFYRIGHGKPPAEGKGEERMKCKRCDGTGEIKKYYPPMKNDEWADNVKDYIEWERRRVLGL